MYVLLQETYFWESTSKHLQGHITTPRHGLDVLLWNSNTLKCVQGPHPAVLVNPYSLLEQLPWAVLGGISLALLCQLEMDLWSGAAARQFFKPFRSSQN